MRVKTGIEGLDEMLGGGIPEGHSIAVIGAFGTGKTTFAMQYIWEGLKNGEKCIYISLEEDEKSIVDSAAKFGWDFSAHLSDNLLLVRMEPEDAKSSIRRIEAELPQIIKDFGATRIAVDSVSLLTMMFRSEEEKREAILMLSKSIKESGATAVFTAEADPRNPYVSREGIIEYVVDGVILLSFREEGNMLKLVLRILKMRRAKHSREVKPYEITEEGIRVLSEAAIF